MDATSNLTVEGQVLHKRALSRKIVFLDIKVQPRKQDVDADLPTHLELVIKLGTFGEVPDVERVRDSCSLGDVIQATGWLESRESCTMIVTSLSHVSHWAAAYPPHQRAPAFQPDPESVAWWNKAYSSRKKSTVTAAATATAGGSTEPQQSLSTAADCTSAEGVSVINPAAATPVCKFWINTGRCARGDDCLFAHPHGQHVKGTRKQYLKDRLTNRKLGAAEDGFFIHAEGDASAKRARAAVFARWLVNTWGKDALNTGSGVLDVAGGRGALSWELQVVHGVKVTLVEPRPFKLSKYQHKARKAMRKAQRQHHDDNIHQQQQQQQQTEQEAGSNSERQQDMQATGATEEEAEGQGQVGEAGNEGASEFEVRQGAVTVRRMDLAPGLQITQVFGWFDEGLWKAAAAYKQQQLHDTDNTCSEPALGPQQQQHQHQQLTLKFDSGNTSRGQGLGSPQPLVGTEAYPEEVLDCIANCSVVVGLHPDQATESIIQYANATPGKPFAIMPCCVFPRLYPHRRLHARLKPPQLGPQEHLSSQGKQAGSERDGGMCSDRDGNQAGSERDGGMWEAPQQLMQQLRVEQCDGDLLLPEGYELVTPDGVAKCLTSGVLEVPVTRYAQLVAWLQQQGGPTACTACLSFEGANRVVYRQK